MRLERSFRGISMRLAVQYLTTLGGEHADEQATDGDSHTHRVVGAGWDATLTADTVEVGPSLSLTEVTIVFEGDEDVLDSLVEEFAQKAMRAGG